MDLSTVIAYNKGKEPIFLTFTTRDSFRINPAESVKIQLTEPSSIYYLQHYVRKLSSIVFTDLTGAKLTHADFETSEADFTFSSLDIINGVPPFRDIPNTDELDYFTHMVHQNKYGKDLGSLSFEPNELTLAVDGTAKSILTYTPKWFDITEVTENMDAGGEAIVSYKWDGTTITFTGLSEGNTLFKVSGPYVKDPGFVKLKVNALANGKVTIKYVCNGQEIRSAVVSEKPVGSKETFNAVEVSGYENPTPTTKSITYTKEPQEIVFTYTKVGPAKTSLKLTVHGVETSGDYVVSEVTQAEYLALDSKDENTLYEVQPADSGSGRVHFLGSQIVDLTKDKDGNVVYSRNLLENTSSEWKEFTFTGYDVLPLFTRKLTALGVVVGDTITMSEEIDYISGTSGQYASTKIKFYTAENVRINQVTGNNVNVGETKVSVLSAVIPENTGYIQFIKASKKGSAESTLRIRNRKLIKGAKDAMDEYTPAPEDIVSSVNSGGGTFG